MPDGSDGCLQTGHRGKEMKCGECKYKWNFGNTEETGVAVCSYPASHMPVNVNDDCHFLPEAKELKCGDCDRLYEDFACYGYTEEDSAMTNGKLCWGFIDKKGRKHDQHL